MTEGNITIQSRARYTYVRSHDWMQLSPFHAVVFTDYVVVMLSWMWNSKSVFASGFCGCASFKSLI